MNLTYTYDLLEEESFLKALKKHSGSFALITDKKVATLYAKPLLAFMGENELECSLVTFPGREKNKTRKMKETIEDSLFDKGLGRDTLLLVMGGGVVTDIGGFVAATYCRGLPYVSIPTTLLGMVDASIGGKTGVNTKQGKNLIGAIYPPKEIFIDFSILSTLPDEEMLNGSAEVIKHMLIFDRSSFNAFEEEISRWKERDLDFLKKIIKESCRTKMKVTDADPKEVGKRRMLNFGHTIGHALEALEEYTLSHGEAVAIGMIVESFISHKMGHLKEEDFDAIYALIKEMGFPLKLSPKVTVKGMEEAMTKDKKSVKKTPRFVVLDGIGKVLSFKGEYCTAIDPSLLNTALGWMNAEFA